MRLFRSRATNTGARPGALAIPADAPPPKISFIDYTETEINEAEVENRDDMKAVLERPSITWFDIQGLGDESLFSDLKSIFSLHELLVADIANVPQRPKIEDLDDKLLFVTRMFAIGKGHEILREQVSILVGPNYVITFQEGYGDTLDPVRSRLRAAKGRIRKSGSDYLAYAILDTILGGIFPVLEDIGEELVELEDAVMFDPRPELLFRINELKSTTLILRRSVWPTRDSLNGFLRTTHPLVDEAVIPYFRDTLDHCAHAMEIVEAIREHAGGVQNTYLSASGNRMNEIMKVLTIMASIFIPLTFLAGIYGMNFESMPELRVSWAYPALLLLMLFTALGMLYYFWRRGWLFQGDSSRDDRGPSAKN